MTLSYIYTLHMYLTPHIFPRFLFGIYHLCLHEGRGLLSSSQLCFPGGKPTVNAHYNLVKGTKL